MKHRRYNGLIGRNSIVDKCMEHCMHFLTIEPILPNLIAIGLTVGALVLCNHPSLLPSIGKYIHFLKYSMFSLIFIQVIRSAKYSLFIPVLAIAIAALGFYFQPLGNHHFFTVNMLQYMMLTGVLGLGVSILAIR